MIEGEYTELQKKYTVEGSYDSKLLRTYMKQFHFALQEKREISENFYARTNSGEDVMKVREESIERHTLMRKTIRDYTIDFIEKNKCSLSSVFILARKILF